MWHLYYFLLITFILINLGQNHEIFFCVWLIQCPKKEVIMKRGNVNKKLVRIIVLDFNCKIKKGERSCLR